MNGVRPLELTSLARTLPVAGVDESSAIVIVSGLRVGGVPGPPAAITDAGVISRFASMSAEAAAPTARRRKELVGWSVTSVYPSSAAHGRPIPPGRPLS